MAADIGELIFLEILKMTQYPGSPFTGNIINDLIMFLFVPSVFIILFVYMILGRLFAAGQTRLRLLMGITIYLFIVAGGYYPAFALIAGPYFIFLIFFLGIIFFVFGHFGVKRGHTMPGRALEEERAIGDLPGDIRTLLGIPEALNPAERKKLREELEGLKKRRDYLAKHDPEGRGSVQLDRINEQIDIIKRKIKG